MSLIIEKEDGLDDFGSRVSSGVYFYTLVAKGINERCGIMLYLNCSNVILMLSNIKTGNLKKGMTCSCKFHAGYLVRHEITKWMQIL